MTRVRPPTAPKRKKKDGPRKTPGPKTKFSPSRVAFLTSHLNAYFACSVRKRYQGFWHDVLPQYWRKFPWHIPLNVEPTDDNLDVVEDDSPAGRTRKQDTIQIVTKVCLYSIVYRIHQLIHCRASRPGSVANFPRVLA